MSIKKILKKQYQIRLLWILQISTIYLNLYNLLNKNGIFVFATQHPCIVALTDKYLTAHSYKGISTAGQHLKH